MKLGGIGTMVAIGLAAQAICAHAQLRAEVNAEGCTIREGDQTVLHYQTKLVDLPNGGLRASNFIHPLAGLDGEPVTDLSPKDHPHHRAIFWSWHQLTVGGEAAGDPWICEDFIWEHLPVEVLAGPDGMAGFETEVLWKSPLWKEGKEAFVSERVRVEVHPMREDSRAVDFTIALRALTEEVRLGGSDDVKGYGGFCARLMHPEGAVFTGEGGVLTPQNEGVEAGPWMNLAGERDGKPYAYTLMQHPENPAHPQPTLLRKAYAYSNCQNAIWPGRTPVLLPTEKPVVLKYRLLQHRGIDPAAAYAEYVAGR